MEKYDGITDLEIFLTYLDKIDVSINQEKLWQQIKILKENKNVKEYQKRKYVDSIIKNCLQDSPIQIYNAIFQKPFQNETYVLLLLLYTYEKQDFSLKDNIYKLIYQDLFSKTNDTEEANRLLNLLTTGKRNSFSYLYLQNKKTRLFLEKIDSIDSMTDITYLHNVPLHILENINQNHLFQIREQLHLQNFPLQHIDEVSINLYIVLGFERAMHVVKGKYGPLTNAKYLHLFTGYDLCKVTFEQQGKVKIPYIYQNLIHIFFGKNYKDTTSPFFQLLHGSVDENIRLICSQLPYFFSNWFQVQEKYIEIKNQNNLKTKLNASMLSFIFPLLKTVDIPCHLNLDYTFLKQAMHNKQYVKPELQNSVMERIITLAEVQQTIQTKKFPNVMYKDNETKITILNPNDPKILFLGYMCPCCFRANGIGDNDGKKNSLLRYCVATEYGGAIEFQNKNGEVIAFSPIFRNGNLLMVHSLEYGHLLHHEKNILLEKLKLWANQMIFTSYQTEENPIEIVTLTDMNGVDKTIMEGTLKEKVSLYDETQEYQNTYHNLDNDQFILSQSSKFKNLKLGDVEKQYLYHRAPYNQTPYLSNDTLNITNKIDILKKSIIFLSKKLELSNTETYKYVDTLQNIEQEYLQLLDIHFIPYNQYKQMTSIIKQINPNVDNVTYNQILYGKDWFIGLYNGKYNFYNCTFHNHLEWKQALQEHHTLTAKKII